MNNESEKYNTKTQNSVFGCKTHATDGNDKGIFRLNHTPHSSTSASAVEHEKSNWISDKDGQFFVHVLA